MHCDYCRQSIAQNVHHYTLRLELFPAIEPSLEISAAQMRIDFAAEMERQGFSVPLLIGGATTSKAHTAYKVEPAYSHPTVHVLDASRAVPVAQQLLSDEHRDAYVAGIRSDYDKVRERLIRKRDTRVVELAAARNNRFKLDPAASKMCAPNRPGVTALRDFPLGELVERIDWTPFFATWQLSGKFPAILTDKVVGTHARELHRDALIMLDRIAADRSLTAHGVVGLWPANSVGDDIEVYADPKRSAVIGVLHHLRQQRERTGTHPHRCLADYLLARGSEQIDYIGAFAVTAGHGVAELVARYEAEHDDYHAIMAKALADRLAEAFAELLHERVRKDLWGYAANEDLDNDALIAMKYRGIRPAPGYPACPDHTEKPAIWQLLQAQEHTGATLTDSFAMSPAASVCGLYFAHPDAKYFGLGPIGADQVADYARRKGMTRAQCERWLAPNLAY